MRGRIMGEEGSLWPIFIVFGLVILGLTTVVLDVTQTFTYRRYVNTIADGASLAGADGIDEGKVYETGVGTKVELDTAAASQKVAEYMGRVTGPNKPNCYVDGAVAGGKVTVECQGSVQLPMTNWFTMGRVNANVTLDASAEAFTQGQQNP